MYKKIVLLIVFCFLFTISCSSPNNPDSGNQGNNGDIGDNGGSIVTPPPTGPTEEELLVEKYGIDISQEDAVISQKIEENLKAYFAEKNSYRVIFTGTPKDYTQDANKSLSILTLNAAVNISTAKNIDMDIRNIDFQNGTINMSMFSGEIIDNTIILNFIFPENKIKTIGDGAFSFLSNLKEITIPASVTRIGVGAFQNCDNLVKLNLKNGLEIIDDMAFFYVQFLSEVIIPDSVKTIGDQAFANDTIKKLQLSSSLESIGMQAFINLEVEELTIPASVKTIGDQAFAYSFTALKRVVYYGDSPDIISYTGNVFDSCFSLNTLKVPNAKNDKDPKWTTFLGGTFTTVTK